MFATDVYLGNVSVTVGTARHTRGPSTTVGKNRLNPTIEEQVGLFATDVYLGNVSVTVGTARPTRGPSTIR